MTLINPRKHGFFFIFYNLTRIFYNIIDLVPFHRKEQISCNIDRFYVVLYAL